MTLRSDSASMDRMLVYNIIELELIRRHEIYFWKVPETAMKQILVSKIDIKKNAERSFLACGRFDIAFQTN